MLTLPIKKKWYDMILSGEKTEEYRKVSPYYTMRFKKFITLNPNYPDDFIQNVFEASATDGGLPYTGVILKNGCKILAPAMLVHGKIMIRTGRPEWGAAEGEKYYVLTIEEKEILMGKSSV